MDEIKEIEEYCRHSYAYFYSSTAKEHVLCLLLHIKELKIQYELLLKDKKVLNDLFMKYHARVGELEANELHFPTLSEFSNLQEDYEKAQTRIKELEEHIKELEGKVKKLNDFIKENYPSDHLDLVQRSKELEEGKEYLIRLFKIIAPQCEPMDNLSSLISQFDNYIAGQNQRVKELEEGIHLLIDFIPDGWEVPVGWTTVVGQARKLIEKEKP